MHPSSPQKQFTRKSSPFKTKNSKTTQLLEQLSRNKYLQNIELLLDEQISLELINEFGNFSRQKSKHQTLRQVLSAQLKQCMQEINIQYHRMQRLQHEQVYSQFLENSTHKILELQQKSMKLKEFYLYCKFLTKQSTTLEDNIEKYYEFAKKDSTLVSQLQAYLNNPFIGDILFRQYLKTYNVNIFTSDLVQHYFQLNQLGLLKPKSSMIFQAGRIQELQILEKKNVVFKQLYDINLKYTELQQDMKYSYINDIISIVGKNKLTQQYQRENSQQSSKKSSYAFEQYNDAINQKLQNLNYLINKMTIMGSHLAQTLQQRQIPVLVNQYEHNYSQLNNYIKFNHNTLVSSNSKFSELNPKYKEFLVSMFKNQDINKNAQTESLTKFLEENLVYEPFGLDDKEITENSSERNEPSGQNEQKFQFLQEKIIKTQCLLVLNKIFSTFNLFSYILEQINQESGKEVEYEFGDIDKHIRNDFRNEFIKGKMPKSCNNGKQKDRTRRTKTWFHSPSHKAHFNVFIETDQFGNFLLLSGNQKLLYPSAISSMFNLLHYMLDLSTILQHKSLYSLELMHQILSLKSEQVAKLGQVLFNIYNLIKSKQVYCYPLLKKYMEVLLKGLINFELQWVQRIDLSQEQHTLFQNQLQELDRARNLSEKDEEKQKAYLEERKRISNDITKGKITRFLTFYAEKAKKADFLSQIIYELDSNYEPTPVLQSLLKCEQHYNKTFYFTDQPQFYETVLYEIIQMRNHIKLDHYFTLSKLHETFGFFTVKALSFGDILNLVGLESSQSIKIEELLLFFKTQLRLKRAVFKGQLNWILYKNLLQSSNSTCENTFKQLVQQQAKDIISLSQQPLQYFLSNINHFSKLVSVFEHNIGKYKHLYVISAKSHHSPIRIKNIESHLSLLTREELSEIQKVFIQFNPIVKILKQENQELQLFQDLKMSVQINGRVRFQDSMRNVFMIDEKLSLSGVLFLLKSFSFDLSYTDCFNILVPKQMKSCICSEEQLKLLINREKSSIVRHYVDVMNEDKKNIDLAISFYRNLLLVSLLEIMDEITDEHDIQIIEEVVRNIDYKEVNFVQLSQYVKSIFAIINTNNSSNALSHATSSSIITHLLRQKHFLINLQSLTSQQTVSAHSSFSSSVYRPSLQKKSQEADNLFSVVQNICLVGKLTNYTQKRIVQKIQAIHHDIIEKQLTSNKRILKQLHCLNRRIERYFLKLLKKQQQNMFERTNSGRTKRDDTQTQKQDSSKSITQFPLIPFQSISTALESIQTFLNQQILALTPFKSLTYEQKQEMYLFDQLCGYKVPQPTQTQNLTASPNQRSKDLLRRNDRKIMKKGLFSPVRSAQTAQNNIMQNIQKRVGIEMIKESMALRKVISKLELEQKKMKDEIAWQTSKLQHNVIKKIHAFITESNMDQEQSYINFKYTVNLETIKGMQNVIKEQTELALKASQETMNKQYTEEELKQHDHKPSQSNDIFLTSPLQTSPQSTSLNYQNTRMLNTNIESIFAHMKKIHIFAAWKKIHRNMDLTNQEWKNFNKNVANILHNQENIKKVQRINQKRNECFKENILCSLLKQENSILSAKIRNAKVESLMVKVEEYRKKLTGEVDPQGND